MNLRIHTFLPLLAAVGLLAGSAAAMYWAPGCPVRESTGLKCPGCGTGRAAGALLKGDISALFYWNATLLPMVLLLLVAAFSPPWRWRGWLLLGVLTLSFGIVRNLPFYLLY